MSRNFFVFSQRAFRLAAAALACSSALLSASCGGAAQRSLVDAPLMLREGTNPDLVGPGKGLVPDTWSNIHAFQVFDGDIPPGQAQSDASRYDAVWGSDEPSAWKAGNPRIVTGYYAPFDGDFHMNSLEWWKSHHPSWVLYKCDKTTPAWPSGLMNVPLDISNPATVAWQMATYGPTIEADGYTGLDVDLVDLNNADGGCGVWINGVWKPRFTGQFKDASWTAAVLDWLHYAYAYLHGLPRPLYLGVNNVPEARPLGDPSQIDLINHTDLIDDEQSFTMYGNGYASSADVSLIVGWMKYTQGLGKAWVVDDKFNVNTLSDQQLGWAISTYLLGKYHSAALFADHLPGYGYQYWHPQYLSEIGSPCGDAYGYAHDNGLYLRKYTAALIVSNASVNTTYKFTLPKSSYVDIFGNKITSPMSILPDDGDVLLTTSGCK
jgi:hypothetical protein